MSSSAHYLRHSLMLAGPAPYSGSNSELPPYTRHQATNPSCHQGSADHVFTLANGKGRPWAMLRLISSATSSGRMPTYYQGDHVFGSLQLNLEKQETISSIVATVTGKIVTGAGSEDYLKFLDHSSTIWSKSMGDPRSNLQGDYKGKLQGEYIWPVDIEIPKSANVFSSRGAAGQVFNLPQTFLEPNIRASVEYTLTIRISRSKLRSDSVLTTNFAYLAIIRPEPLSLLRQLAYQENSLLPGPEADPEGWKASSVAVSRGSYNTTRYVVAKCQLWLAKPLCYTRGSAIPCLLDIVCDDRKALDVLSSTTTAVVTLQRRVKYYLASASPTSRKDVGWKEVVEDVNSAVWWPSVEGARTSSPTSRRLDGEIRLPRLLHPTSAMAHFSVTYAVVLKPFQAPSYKPGETAPLLAETIEVATRYAKGPVPKPFSPPGYDAPKRPSCQFLADLDAGGLSEWV